MVKFVIVAPYYETATQLWSPFLKGWVANELKKRGVEPVVLWGDDAVPDKFNQAIQDPDVKGVLGVMHGNEEEATGQNYVTILWKGMPIPDTMKDDVIAPVSCLVGKDLMPWLAQQGIPYTVGEITEYWFTAEDKPRQGNDPEEDQLLKFYLYAEYTFWFRLAEGFDTGTAYQMMIQEYDRQIQLASQVDAETAYWLGVDKENRKAWGNPQYIVYPKGVKTNINVDIRTTRLPKDKTDTITVTGKVTAEDNSIPQGQVIVRINDRQDTIQLTDDGTFIDTQIFQWDKNEEITYNIQVVYTGFHDDKVYMPSHYETQVKVEPVYIPTVLKITNVETSRDQSLVNFNIAGVLMDKDGNPLQLRQVEVDVANGEILRYTVITDTDGKFKLQADKSYPPLQTKATITASYSGDDVYQGSSDTVIAKFPPNWDVIKVILAAIGGGIAILLIILSSIL
ncbi:MAG: hypothetical protein JHC26_06650 [Thermofilum sp.]|uniref:hypothetical protein n=1 Tax=Thermofilum sp. TaxID=1961369 RepID=UPI002589C6C1|nr:hypothetical protein [Thermofilum sp.]MCI4408753.1 hypothetical protein [Thermofilum sp.]